MQITAFQTDSLFNRQQNSVLGVDDSFLITRHANLAWRQYGLAYSPCPAHGVTRLIFLLDIFKAWECLAEIPQC